MEASNLDNAAPTILRAIAEGLEWEQGVLWLVDAGASVLRYITTWHTPSIVTDEFEKVCRQISFSRGMGLPGRVWAAGEPVWLADLLNDNNFPRLHAAASAGLQSALAFPISGGSGILGVVEFLSREVRPPDEDLIRSVITIGNQLGQFIEKKRAEDAARASEIRKGAIVENALDAMVSIDHQGRVIEFNAAAEKMFGYNRKEVLGQEMAELIVPPSLRQRHYEGLAHYLVTGEGALIGRRVEMTAMRADGTEFPIELAITRIPLDGLPIFNASIRDITVAKRIEEERFQILLREQVARAEAEAATRKLEALQLVTDTALTHLGLDDLLHELLIRVREIMTVDNVAILLFNEHGHYLTMRAVIGPEEEVAKQVRVPIGRGFAGTIAAQAKPRIVEDLSTVEVMTPLLREKLKSLLGVPLLIEDRVIGVMHIGTVTSRRFTQEDVQLLQRVADRIALAITQSRLYEAEQTARAEAAMRAGELEATFDTIADAILVYSSEGELIQMNTAARELAALVAQPDTSLHSLNRRRYEFVLRSEDDQILPEDQWPRSRVLQGEVLKGGNTMDVVLDTLDGRKLRFSVSGAPVLNQQGHIIGAVTVYRDVTERRLLEQRTHKALNALLSIAEALVQVPDAAEGMEQAASDTFAAVSKVAQRLAELTCSVLGCQRVSISIVEPQTEVLRAVAVVGLTPEQERQWWAEQKQQESSLSESSNPELVSALRTNQVLILDMTQPPYRDQPNPYSMHLICITPMMVGDQLMGLLALDFGGAEHEYTSQEIELAKAVAQLAALVIERERLLQERAEAQANELALRNANQRMDEFLGIASHELRTPLTTIKANIQLAKRHLNKLKSQEGISARELANKIEQVQELLARSDQQSGVLNRLVSDLLDVSRIHSDKLELHLLPEPYNLVSLVKEAVEDQRRAVPKRIIRLELPLEEVVPVSADPDRIGQVVKNYLTNALKYSSAERPVEVSLRLEDGMAKVSVHDGGPGLSLHQQEHIWERFYQAPGIKVQSGSSVGLGLGLHISKTIIELHSGQVGVESAPGKGSTFWFTLPLSKQA